MRRSDEEFKAELLLRVRKYKAARERRRIAAMRTASVAMAACFLVMVVSRINFPGIQKEPTNLSEETQSQELETQENEKNIENTERAENTESVMESETVFIQDETESGTGDGKTITQITVATLGGAHFVGVSDSEVYVRSETVEQLAMYLRELAGRAEAGCEAPEEETQAPFEGSIKDEDVLSSTGSDSAQSRMSFGFAISYSDGTKKLYVVVQGKDELGRLEDGSLLLDDASWLEMSELLKAVREEKK